MYVLYSLPCFKISMNFTISKLNSMKPLVYAKGEFFSKFSLGKIGLKQS